MYNKNGRLLTISVVVYRSFTVPNTLAWAMVKTRIILRIIQAKIIYLFFLRCLISEFNRLSPCLLFRSHVSQWKLSVIRSYTFSTDLAYMLYICRCITCCGLKLVSSFSYKQDILDLTTKELLTWSLLNFP